MNTKISQCKPVRSLSSKRSVQEAEGGQQPVSAWMPLTGGGRKGENCGIIHI